MGRLWMAGLGMVIGVAPALAQNVAPETGNPQTEVKLKEQGETAKKPSDTDTQAGVQADVQAPKPSTTSSTGGNLVGPHTTP